MFSIVLLAFGQSALHAQVMPSISLPAVNMPVLQPYQFTPVTINNQPNTHSSSSLPSSKPDIQLQQYERDLKGMTESERRKIGVQKELNEDEAYNVQKGRQ